MKKFRTITLAVALTTALSMGAVGAQASTLSMNVDTGNSGRTTTAPIGTLGTGTGSTTITGTGTTTPSGYTGSNYDATAPGMGLGTGVNTPNFSGNGTTGNYNGSLTTPNTYSGYGTTRGTGVMDHINGFGTNVGDKAEDVAERAQRGVNRSVNTVDRMSTKSLSTTPPSTYGTSYRAYSTTDTSKGMNWGWLGLLGLLGLFGMRSSNRGRDESYR
ncbi:WGxxGxxG family protein [Paenibacillus roseipurpureus]|uniref:WGxxGxxG family protein n=1 Tax=Paenibacillus roseopurpureus TaxID=2918901 RepID=A0AA96LMB4_9BACL|nr:WGxxGxxG family protein [Paenibacillus sp. MBLB1832]WNR43722.1 WGxxGxxG family protein [Paenibacillus sp. MBLB1832]